MISWCEGRVSQVLSGWPGVVRAEVVLAGSEQVVPALAYVDVVGAPEVGDRVLLNTSALDKGLGTGGGALVVAVDRGAAWPSVSGPGHLVKARYTPLQTMVLGVDDPEGEHHGVLAEADSIDGMPVVAADLHSSLPAVLAGLRAGASSPELRVAYIMTDGGALPLAFSRAVAGLREAGWLAATVTAGQAYGGDLEAVTVHTALLAARHVVGADVAVVIQGPGNLGTGTRWGFSGVAAGEALNAAAVLGGRGVAVPRVSEADPRERHRGLSHHSVTAYGRVLTQPADVPVAVVRGGAEGLSEGADGGVEALPASTAECLARAAAQVHDLAAGAPHLRPVEVDASGLVAALADSPVRLSTMGRGLEEDLAAFVAAAAAGRHAASLLGS